MLPSPEDKRHRGKSKSLSGTVRGDTRKRSLDSKFGEKTRLSRDNHRLLKKLEATWVSSRSF